MVRIIFFSGLVERTEEKVDQSLINFVVIVKVLNVTRNIVNDANFNDTDLTEV